MNPQLADNPYINDILSQSEALHTTLDSFESLPSSSFHRLARRLSAGSLQRVALTGMGASFHALHPLQLKLIEAGIQTYLFETSELIHYAPRLLSPDTLVVAVSQSGRSIETLQLLNQLPEGTPLIGVTNTANSPLAQKSEALLLTQAGAEHSVSCKTYVTALAALTLLGELLTGGDPVQARAACREAADRAAFYLSQWNALVEAAMCELADVRSLIVVGRGPSLAAVGTGSLIIKESAHVHAEGMSSAAFRHGPLELISAGVAILAYAGTGSGAALNARLVDDIRAAGGSARLIAPGADGLIYNLPEAPPDGLSIVEILPMQLASVALAALKGHTPGHFAHGSKVTGVA